MNKLSSSKIPGIRSQQGLQLSGGLRSVSPTPTVSALATPTLIVLLDCSGSMAGSKIELAWSSLRDVLVPRMKAWRLGIIRFPSQEVWSAGASWAMTPRLIQSLKVSCPEARGETPLYAALQLAWQWHQLTPCPVRLVLITDGHQNDSTEAIILRDAHRHQLITDCIGISPGSDVPFLRALADVTGGLFYEAPLMQLFTERLRALSPAERPALSAPKEQGR